MGLPPVCLAPRHPLWASGFSEETVLTDLLCPHEPPRANLAQFLILATCDTHTSGMSQKGL